MMATLCDRLLRYYPQVGLDYGFDIFLGFGFGFGFSISLRSGWIMDSIYLSDLDLGSDWKLITGRVGFQICII